MLAKQAWRLLAIWLCVALTGSSVMAATERYDYDPLGRLTRVVDGSNKAVDYVYDAAGNLLEVRAGSAVAAPVVAGVTPAALRRGQSVKVSITGSGFAGVNVAMSDAGLTIGDLQVAPQLINLTLSATESAALGPQTLTISSAGGSAAAAVTVLPRLPTVNVDPAPLAIPPDNVLRQFTIRLSNTDTVAHTIALSASNGNIALSPASVTIPAGELSVAAGIQGIGAGQATITLSSATLGTTLVPVFVTSEFVGITTSLAPMLGVVLQQDGQSSATPIGPLPSVPLGVLVGSAVRGAAPDRLGLGSSAIPLTVSGIGLDSARTVAVEPDTGITVGAPSVAADGLSLTVPVSVAADAPPTQRRIVVRDAAGAVYPVASPLADRIDIVRPAPRIDSIEPLAGTPDSTLTLTVRGRNLQDARAILFNPATGIATDAAPAVNAEGTVLTAGVSLSLGTPAGDYAVAVTTPGGTSSAATSANNTFKVVNEVRQAVTPIVASAVGVLLQDADAPTGIASSLTARPVGVAVGAVATRLSPAVGIVGQSAVLTIQGHGLNAVNGVDIAPTAGITLGAPTPAADGESVSVPIAIAPDAPQTARKVRLTASAVEVPFASSAAAQFLVSLPLPQIDSITPIVLQMGQPATPLVVRGHNLQNAEQVRVVPSDGMTVSAPPVVSADGMQLTVDIAAAADAAPGARLVTVVTPAGESPTTASVSNTLTLARTTASTVSPVTSALVGIVKQEAATPVTTTTGPVLAPALGVVLQDDTPPVAASVGLSANRLGIALGAYAIGLDADGFEPGFSGNLLVRGTALGTVTSVGIVPAAGIALGTPTVSPDGRQLSVPMTVDAGAARGIRGVRLAASAGPVLFADSHAGQFRVGPGVPQISSITPILAKQGDVVTLTIRGANFLDAQAVTAAPDSGLSVVPGTLTVNADGTELTVSLAVAVDAPLGSRVIQVAVPGAVSDGVAAPANTFTVFPP